MFQYSLKLHTRPTAALGGVLLTLCAALPVHAATASGIFISEYLEGSAFNKALEIYNGSAADANLGDLRLDIYFNGSDTPGRTISLSDAPLAPGDVFVLAHGQADPLLLARADQTAALSFNGDDAVVLRSVDEGIFDAIGQVGVDPGLAWESGVIRTADGTLRRRAALLYGDPWADDPFDPSLQWQTYGLDDFDGLGAHHTAPVPVPASVWLFVAGALSLLALRRRNRTLANRAPGRALEPMCWLPASAVRQTAHSLPITAERL